MFRCIDLLLQSLFTEILLFQYLFGVFKEGRIFDNSVHPSKVFLHIFQVMLAVGRIDGKNLGSQNGIMHLVDGIRIFRYGGHFDGSLGPVGRLFHVLQIVISVRSIHGKRLFAAEESHAGKSKGCSFCGGGSDVAGNDGSDTGGNSAESCEGEFAQHDFFSILFSLLMLYALCSMERTDVVFYWMGRSVFNDDIILLVGFGSAYCCFYFLI
mmetsp:Transcript_9945/g.21379  ORF Transcript_9945/g.21379 Transcript_9945/m.21379 type:complete len:211 (-) Transcript_9945:39-671(-)